MKSWAYFQKRVRRAIEKLRDRGCAEPYFRGHGDASWELLPGLGRQNHPENTENRLFYRFTALGAHLIPDWQ